MIAALILAVTSLAPVQVAAIDGLVEQERARQHVAAVSLAIGRNGRVIYERAYGDADPIEHRAANPSTIFGIGSVSEQFTAALVMQLVESRRIALDDHLDRYLPAIPHAGELTIRHLLAQTSGLPDYLSHVAILNYLHSTTITPGQLVEIATESGKLDFAPGSKWAFSNTNYVVLGMLIERVTGRRYSDVLATEILGPLALHSTYYEWPVPAEDVATGVWWNAATETFIPDSRWSSQVAYSAGALSSNAEDLVLWDDALFGGSVVGPAALQEATLANRLNDGTYAQYGFGWILSKVYGHRELWDTGGIGGFTSRDAYFPDDRIAIAVLANSFPFRSDAIVRKTFATVAGLTTEEVAAEEAPTPTPGENAAITKRARAEYDAWVRGAPNLRYYSDEMKGAVNDAMVRQVEAGLQAAGTVKSFVYQGWQRVQTYDVFSYLAICENGRVSMVYTLDMNGKVRGLFFKPEGL